MMYDNDVFDVTLYDKNGNELYCTKVATFDRVTDWLADRAIDDSKAWTAMVRGQHGQCGEVNLAELYDRLVIEGYVY